MGVSHMTIAEIVENVRASFEMENMIMTHEDEQRGLDILNGKSDIEQAVEEIKRKYTSAQKAV